MDPSPYLELKIAPRAVFDSLEARRAQPRFMVPVAGGDWRAVSWGDFAEQIRDVALYLHHVGLVATERAVVFAPNSVPWLSAALGSQAAGGVMVPIYPASTAEQAAYVVEHSDAKVVFTSGAELLSRIVQAWSAYDKVEHIVLLDDEPLDVDALLSAQTADSGARLPSRQALSAKLTTWSELRAVGAEQAAAARGKLDELLDAVDLDLPGLMLYTSGTTGPPKGVPLSHRNVAVNGRDWLTCNASVLDEGAVDLLWLPMSHIFGFGEACLGNTLGFVSYLSSPQQVLTQLPKIKPTVFMSVPAYWEKLAAQALQESTAPAQHVRLRALTGGRLRFCLSGGAGLKPQIKQLYHDAGMLILEGYGLTECSPTLTINRPDAFRFDAVGKVLPSVELKLAEDGEILARGQSVFAGYHKDPQATAAAFTEDGWFKTGDIGKMSDDGFLRIVDRKKEILVTAGGKNVAPANIEQRFADEAAVAHAVVYGDGKKYLVAGLWLSPEGVEAALAGQTLDQAQRKQAVSALVQGAVDRTNQGLARFEQIKRYQVMDGSLTVQAGLLTATLKLRRKKVYEAFRDRFEALYETSTAASP